MLILFRIFVPVFQHFLTKSKLNTKKMSTVVLNVVSEGNVNCTSYASIFDTDKMSNIRANQNPATTPTFTEAGDAQGIMSAWSFTSPSGKLL